MLATVDQRGDDRAVLARLNFQDASNDADAALTPLGRIAGDTFPTYAVRRPEPGPALRVAGHPAGPLGTSPAARVLERYLDRLNDRLAQLSDAIDRADAAAVDDLLAEVVRASRQHGCRSVCRAAETARTDTHNGSAEAFVGLRRTVGELSELADEVADSARHWTTRGDTRPRA